MSPPAVWIVTPFASAVDLRTSRVRLRTAELASNFEYDEPVTIGVVVLEVR